MVQELVADPMDRMLVDVNITHLSDVGGGPCGIFPRMYILGNLSHWGSILGVMGSECMFMGIVHLKMV